MVNKKNKNYYDIDQEQAVLLFLKSKSNEERTKIYREHLQDPINKMIEIIIRRYKLERKSEDFPDIHADALSFLMTKFDKFKPERNKKSYSYFGTICRNYLKGELIKEYKKNRLHTDIETAESELLERADQKYRIDDDGFNTSVFLEKLMDKLKEEINSENLNDNEFKVGHSLIKILEDWEELFADASNKSHTKFNKNLILLYIRNMTGLSTKEIRNSMKRFKTLYFIFKNDFIEE